LRQQEIYRLYKVEDREQGLEELQKRHGYHVVFHHLAAIQKTWVQAMATVTGGGSGEIH
jgi:hypothetical protein